MSRFVLVGAILLLVSVCAGVTMSLDGLVNCAVVPVGVVDIKNVAVPVRNLDPEKTYEIKPISGAVMYFPGNERENYLHYAWSIAVTPENCAMGAGNIKPLCGSKDDVTCCWYSTARLGSPPPLLHSGNATTALQEVADNLIYVRGQKTVWVWFEDDNCSNNKGTMQFSVLPVS
jgi:hypothetical protein